MHTKHTTHDHRTVRRRLPQTSGAGDRDGFARGSRRLLFHARGVGFIRLGGGLVGSHRDGVWRHR